ncbi:flagellar hook assembly protein FlgD [Halobacillus salinarum]|uniref:Flagellar hook assembly protein FlgD n=1 Tax=Halobacillus salinarum TaxID=2932257 RepID=A0ABY4EQM1_9BACI|nr:flagellar hook assembly protein FlgD [Halobacillus salinarum]
MTTIDPSYYLKNQQPKSTSNNELGKDEFLKILMAQLQNQNPLDPMKDKEFISQMTQFSSLEQMTNMSQAMQNFLQTEQQPPVVQYSSLIGKEVTYPVYDEETGEFDHNESAVVEAVGQEDGNTILELANETTVLVDEITKVSHTKESN